MESSTADFEFVAADAGRLDKVLTAWLETQALERKISRSLVQSWIEGGNVEVDFEEVHKCALKLKAGQTVSLTTPPDAPTHLVSDSSIKLNVVFEDKEVLVINKPAGLIMHPGAGNPTGTLANGLVAYLGDQLCPIGDALRPGLVHRLDKDTSGLLVVAKTEKAFQNLTQQFLPPRTVKRTYLAFCERLPEDADSGTIELPIGRDTRERKKMAVVTSSGKTALTRWRVKEPYRYGALLEVELETGRTHQIRVHLQALNAAILGDETYKAGLPRWPKSLTDYILALRRQALHASELRFIHPQTKEQCHFTAPLPNELTELAKLLGSA